MESLIQLDEQLFHIINHDWQNAFLDAVLPYWRDKKTWIPLYVLLTFQLALLSPARTIAHSTRTRIAP